MNLVAQNPSSGSTVNAHANREREEGWGSAGTTGGGNGPEGTVVGVPREEPL